MFLHGDRGDLDAGDQGNNILALGGKQ